MKSLNTFNLDHEPNLTSESEQLPAIVEAAKAAQPKPDVQKAQPNDYEPDVFIQCVEHKTKPGYVYWYKPVLVDRQHQDNRDHIMRAAGNMRSRFEACYGGAWIVVHQTR